MLPNGRRQLLGRFLGPQKIRGQNHNAAGWTLVGSLRLYKILNQLLSGTAGLLFAGSGETIVLGGKVRIRGDDLLDVGLGLAVPNGKIGMLQI